MKIDSKISFPSPENVEVGDILVVDYCKNEAIGILIFLNENEYMERPTPKEEKYGCLNLNTMQIESYEESLKDCFEAYDDNCGVFYIIKGEHVELTY